MEVIPQKIEYYHTSDGKIPYREWYYSLRDIKVKVAIRERLTRMERGLFGDVRSVGKGVYELRLDLGPGYRVYFGQIGRTLVWLLCGGDKSTQNKDIKTAQDYWADHLRRIK
ncbi:MAG: addiction module killer protein [Elusimicrobia bacterium RIFCSPLOWO2_02_FULL_39_32]|nr:MAG: addiction module killer protein [Elusimicrobia bacterium RIFCSPHIGHO2_02_FULL_39_36]OGR92014.1 MAG: addiction module killer protein [Elusimicrobia bacterium RIFCSPLOWO2_02_FULL_39_32]OGR98695.1 MAG: addiction module killer protein [Elusimicrobia bacterium RIFCSPLOWO2_12_FULL_39_28]